MANVIKIKRGSGTPTTSNLAEYQLGYDYTNNKLYIHDPTNSSGQEIVEVGGGSGGDADTLDGINSTSFLRSDANDTWSGNISTTSTNGIRFGNANQTDGNDGYIAAGRFASGLNIVGTQTVAGQGRKVRIYGDLIDSAGVAYIKTNSSLNASNLTSGTVPDARIAASSITQHTDSKYLRSNAADTATGTITFSSGINVGDLSSGGITGSNYNITGVNALSFNDPGPGEGLNFSNFAIYESPNDLSTNSAGNIQFVSGSTRRATIDTSGNLYVQNNITLGGTVDGRNIANDGSKLDGIASGATANAGTVTSVATGTGLTGGTITGSGTISLTNHSGNLITSGTVAAARIANLPASKITSGTFDAARIAHNSFHLGATSAETGRTVKETGLYTYEVNNGNLGTGTETGYYEVLTWGEGTGGSVQLAGQWFSGTAPNMYFRTLRDTTDNWTTWQRLLTVSDEGSGNGLDADTVDGVQASSFLRSDASDTATGTLTLAGQIWNGHITWNNNKNVYVAGESSFDVSGSGVWQVWDSGTSAPFIKCDVGQRTEIGQAGSRGLLVHGELESSSLDCNGNANIDGNVTLAAGHYFTAHNESMKAKYRMYGGSDLYAIGMVSGISYGGLNDWSMTFQFNDEADRGFVFRDSAHTNSQGAMAITTNGKATIAHSLRIGYGESDTTTPGGTSTLEVAGNVDLRSDDPDAARFLHLPRSGGITFYGDASQHHGIFSRNDSNTNNQDDILITSYGAVYIDLDSNNNNTSEASFEIGRHNTANDPFFKIDGETGRVGISESSIDAMLHINPGNALCNIKLERQGVVAWRFGINTSSSDLRFDAGSDTLSGPEVLFTSSGAGHFDNDVVAFSSSTSSDRRLKENIKPIPYGLETVLKMNPVEYDWKEKRDKAHDIGVIAQEVEELIPEIVKEHKDLKTDKPIKTVDYGKMVSVLIKAVQEQQEQINELKEKLNG